MSKVHNKMHSTFNEKILRNQQTVNSQAEWSGILSTPDAYPILNCWWYRGVIRNARIEIRVRLQFE